MSRRLGVFACGCLLALRAAALAAQPSPALKAATASDLATGRRFFDAQCAWCHGAEGTGGAAPSLQRASLKHAANDDALVQIVRLGIPGTDMPGFGLSLNDVSAWQTAAYVRSLGRTTPVALPGDARRGAALYASLACAACHMISGEGVTVGPELTTIGALRGPSHLRESIVKPEASHPPGYLVVRAVAKDGGVTRGIRVNEDVFFVSIRDAAGRLHTLEKSSLKSLERELTGTLMPAYAQLGAAQLDDLVAYLASLRGDR